jgi:SAM-dependent methyltransferase
LQDDQHRDVVDNGGSVGVTGLVNYAAWRVVRGLGWRVDRSGLDLTGRVTLLRRRLAPFLPVTACAVQYPGVRRRVHLDDHMLDRDDAEGLRHYDRVGRQAVQLVGDALALVRRDFGDVRNALDLPSGYGRVTRYLVEAISPSRVTVSDVDPAAVRFCRRELGVNGFVIGTVPEAIELPGRYDLIFVGSLLTHLKERQCVALMRKLTAALAPAGVLVVTTHGESCLEHLHAYGPDIEVAESDYHEGMRLRGMHFAPYEGSSEWGITLHSRDYVERAIRELFAGELRQILYLRRGWDEHQDVFAFERQ